MAIQQLHLFVYTKVAVIIGESITHLYKLVM